MLQHVHVSAQLPQHSFRLTITAIKVKVNSHSHIFEVIRRGDKKDANRRPAGTDP